MKKWIYVVCIMGVVLCSYGSEFSLVLDRNGQEREFGPFSDKDGSRITLGKAEFLFSPADTSDSFYLMSSMNGKRYGAFLLQNGARISLGKYLFILRLPHAPVNLSAEDSNSQVQRIVSLWLDKGDDTLVISGIKSSSQTPKVRLGNMNESVVILCDYPYEEELSSILRDGGIVIPDDWSEAIVLPGATAEWEVSAASGEEIAHFIHSWFIRVIGADTESIVGQQEGYEKSDTIDRSTMVPPVTVKKREVQDSREIVFKGALSTVVRKGIFTEVTLDNFDKGKKTRYLVELDSNGKLLSAHRSGIFQVEGVVSVKNGMKVIKVLTFNKDDFGPPDRW